MLIIQDKLVSGEVIKEQFICNLSKCKGACCWEGDFGAPIEEEEIEILKAIYPKVKPYLSEESINTIDEKGVVTYYKDVEEIGTSLLDNGACSFMIFDSLGRAQCSIERAYLEGEINFKKPISCHLYPIRVEKNEEVDFEALNYDRWDICVAACTLGAEQQMPVYRFLKEPLIRKYGVEFYEELDAAANFMKDKK